MKSRQFQATPLRQAMLALWMILPLTALAVEPLDESGLASIHFPGLPATAAGKAESVAEAASLEAHAESRKALINANEVSQPQHSTSEPSSVAGSAVVSTLYVRDNSFAQAELTHADVVMNLDKATDKSVSHSLENGVSINLSNTVNQIEATNVRNMLGSDSYRGDIAIEAMAVDANIVINAR